MDYSALQKLINLITSTLPDKFISDGYEREIGVASIVFWHHFIAKVAAKNNISIPPVLLSTLATLFTLSITRSYCGKDVSDRVIQFFEPGVNFLGNWMPLWLSPPLVMLPKALRSIKGADAKCWIKLLLVHYGLWMASTAGSAKLFDFLEKGLSREPSQSIEGMASNISNHPTRTTSTSTEAAAVAAALLRKKQLKLLRFWSGLTIAFHAATAAGGGAAAAVPAIASSTVAALSAGNMLPKEVKKVVHPLLVAAFITALSTLAVERLQRSRALGECDSEMMTTGSWIDMLSTFVKGPGDKHMKAGDYFNLLLGPACSALAFRIFSQCQDETIAKRLPAIVTASSAAAIASLFISPAVGAAVGVPAELNAVLSHRSISSALALSSAKATGASQELVLAAVLLTGLYGASGQYLLESIGVKDSITTGVSVGTAAHAIGTASLLPAQPEAAAVASVSMVCAGVAHAVTSSLPGVKSLLWRLASRK